MTQSMQYILFVVLLPATGLVLAARRLFVRTRGPLGRRIVRIRAAAATWLALAAERAVAAPDIMGEVETHIKTATQLLIYIVMIGGYLTAAYMIINGAYRLFTEREGGVQRFILGVIVAIVMVVLMSFFVEQSSTELEKIG